jgi:hypothetical protein
MGGTLLAHSATERVPEPPAPAAPVTEPNPEPVTENEPEPVPEPVPAVDDTPTLPAAEPAFAEPAPAVPVPAALVDHARKVADDHRTRTGSPIDTDTLRARLGVPPQLADAIAAQLA